MFDFFRAKKKVMGASEHPQAIARVSLHVESMGYTLTDAGAAVALLECMNGYSEYQAASHIAHVTLARDAQEAGDDLMKLVQLPLHARHILAVLNRFKAAGVMSDEHCQQDAHAALRLSTLDQYQAEWIAKVLSDPIAGKERLATRTEELP